MQLKIPKEIREKLAADPFMKICIVKCNDCEGRIEWNHAFTYAGKRQNVIWGLLPMCSEHHKRESSFREIQRDLMKSRIFYFNLENEVQINYPKANLV